MKIRLTDEDKLYIDDEIKQIKDLNATLLEQIVENLLNDDCQIDIHKDSPLGSFLKTLVEKTKKESELYKTLKASSEEKKIIADKISNLDLSYEKKQND